MHQCEGRLAFLVCLSLVGLFLMSCGEFSTQKSPRSTQAMQQTLANDEAQGEIAHVLSVTQNSIIEALMPSSGLSLGGCQPKFKMVMVGVGIEFTPSDTCHFSGDILVKLFPTRAQADLEVVGLTFVKAIRFDADIQLSGSDGSKSLDFEFLDGRLSLGRLSVLSIDELVINGRAKVDSNNGTLTVSSRSNVFESSTSAGVALIADVVSQSGNRTSDVRACFLTGGVPTDTDAGTLNRCLSF